MAENLTLEDIGRLAGVSRSTVSRVINGQSNVRPDVRERVEAVIERTGYTPNVLARSLVSGRTGVIGLVIPSGVHQFFEDPYFSRLIEGISSASNKAGNTLSLFIFQDAEEEAALYPRVVKSGVLDGLILTATRMADPLLARMATGDIPLVVVGRPDVDEVSYVDVDNRGGAERAALHLADLGHRRIGLIGAPVSTTAGIDRLEGFREGLARRGLALHPDLRADGDFSEQSGYDAMMRLIPHRPEAVFAASDTMAAGALRALDDEGIAVPGDIALMGFDGLPASERSDPAITTVRQPIFETGSRAVQMLNALIDGEAHRPEVEIMPVELVVRRSTAEQEVPAATHERSGEELDTHAQRAVSADAPSTEVILGRMSLAEKLGQMTQVSNDSITPGEVADHHIGSILSGGNGTPTPNTPHAWLDMVSAFIEVRSGTGVPPVYGVDAVHGHAIARGATVFPHNIGLGAAGDPQLVEAIGQATATEMLATGIRWTFAPAVSVPRDIRWGRTYEGYGRDPDLVSELGAAAVRGLQGADDEPRRVMACAKHFVGDGGTSWGTAPRLDHIDWWDGWGSGWQIDQGDARVSEAELRSVHLPPYRAAVSAGVETVMASYNSWNGEKLHGHRRLLTDVLKGELGFGGFVISDWMGIDQLDASYETCVEQAINAGIDMVMVPEDWRRFLQAITTLASDGRIPMSRIDDAVLRILGAKRRAGILDDTAPPLPDLGVVGREEHRALAAEAVRRSAVLLKGGDGPPIPSSARSLTVAGPAADDIGLACGGWTAGWQGAAGSITDGTTLLDGLRGDGRWEITFDPSGRLDARHDVTILCIAEPPYAEGPGDAAVPSASDEDRALFARMRLRSERIVLVVFSGRPLVVPDLIEQADAVVAAWLPGSEAGALADVLAGRRPFTATTPQPWPRSAEDLGQPDASPLFPVGHGKSSNIDDGGVPAVERADHR